MNKKLTIWIFVMLMLVTTASANIQSGLVSYYSFDSGTTDDVTSNDLTNNGAVQTTGKLSNAYDYEESEGDYMVAPGLILDGLTEYTVCAWVTQESISATKYIFAESSSDWLNHQNTDSEYRSQVNGNFLTSGTAYSSLDTFEYICSVYNSTNSLLYVNNVLKASGTASGTIANTGSFIVGGDLNALNNWDGKIDEVGIWDRGLTSSELTELYNSGNGLNPLNIYDEYYALDLVSRYYLNDTSYNTSNSINDSWGDNAGQGFGKTFYDGTVTGATLVRNLTGTITGATWDTDSVRGNVLSFDGTNDKVNITDSTSLEPTDKTICTWVYPNEQDRQQYIFTKDAKAGYAIYLQASNTFIAIRGNNVIGSGVSIDFNEWQHLCISSDSSGNDVFYKNGIAEYTESYVASIYSTQNLHLAYDQNDDYLNGNLSNFHLYDIALNSTEVLDLYNNERFPLSAENENNFIDGYYTDFHFPLNEGTGTTVSTTESKWDGKYEFDGTNDDITTGDIDITDKITVCTWINPSTLTINDRFIEKGWDTAWTLMAGTSASNVRVYMNGGETVQSSASSLPLNQFTHVCFTYDKDLGGTEEMKMYINGVVDGTYDYSTTIGTNDANLTIGKLYSGSSLYFNGSMDEVKIYNRALSQSEIQAEMEANALADSDGIVAYYDFNGDADDRNHLSTGYDNEADYTNKAINFDGTNDYIIPTYLLPYTDFTISTWISKPTTITSGAVLSMRKIGDGNPLIVLSASTGNRYLLQMRSNAGTGLINLYTTAIADDNFHNLAIKLNSTAVSIYIDGVYNTGTTYTGGTWNNINRFVIGSDAFTLGGTPFGGSISNVRIYDRALTSDEVSTLYSGLQYVNFSASEYITSDSISDFEIYSDFGNLNSSDYLNVPIGTYDYLFSKSPYYNSTQSLTSTSATTTLSFADIFDATTTFQFNQSIYDAGTYKLQVSNTLYGFSTTTGYLTADTTLNLTAGSYTITLLNESTSVFVEVNTIGAGVTSEDYTYLGWNVVTLNDGDTGLPIASAGFTITYPNSDVTALTTNSTGQIKFPTWTSLTAPVGNYSLYLSDISGYITPITFTKETTLATIPFTETYNVSRTTLNINVYYRTNSTLFTETATIVFQGVGNFTTSNGTYNFQDITLATGSYTLQVFAEGYYTEQKVFSYTDQVNSTVDFYMLQSNSTTSNTITVKVLDVAQSKVGGAQVNLLQYNIATLSYESVSQAYTDSDGEAIFLVELNDKSYKINAEATINGEVLTASTGNEGIIFRVDIAEGEAVVFAQSIVTLILSSTTTYTFDPSLYLRYNITENFNTSTNISTISVDFSTSDSSSATVCVEFFSVSLSYSTSEASYCVTGNSGTVTPTVPFLLNRSKQYRLEVYSLNTDGSKVPLQSFNYASDTSFQETFEAYAILKPMMLFFWIVIIAIALFSGVLPIVAVLGVVLAIVEVSLAPNWLTGAGAVLKVLICLQIAYFGRKKEDFN